MKDWPKLKVLEMKVHLVRTVWNKRPNESSGDSIQVVCCPAEIEAEGDIQEGGALCSDESSQHVVVAMPFPDVGSVQAHSDVLCFTA